MPFDVTQINEKTQPTREEVLALFEAGKLEFVKQTFSEQKLIRQWNALAPLAAGILPAFLELELNVVEGDLVLGYRLVELFADPASERVGLDVEVSEQTQAQKALVDQIRRDRDDLQRLAKVSGVPTKLFRVNLGEGDASNALPGARVLINLLEKHGSKLNAPKVTGGIHSRLKTNTAALEASELAQETGKNERTLPAKTQASLRDALYALMLRISRLGPVALPTASDEERAKFSLSILRPASAGTVAVDDDDAPVLEDVETDVPVPAGNVVERPVVAGEPARRAG